MRILKGDGKDEKNLWFKRPVGLNRWSAFRSIVRSGRTLEIRGHGRHAMDGPHRPGGKNPNGVSVSIIEQLNGQFIKHGVKFVIQVGDLTENGTDPDIAIRAAAAQPL